MSFRSSDQTGDSTDWGQSSETSVVRKLTESQGARSDAYELGDETGRIRSQTVARSRPRRSVPVEHEDAADIAAREHIRRLLRQAKDATHDAWAGEDLRDIALAGNRVNDVLRDLWTLRRAREDEWGDGINLLQIVVARLDFEQLERNQRRALYLVFEEDLFGRTVNRSEVERVIQILTDAGFDIWRGLEEREVGEGSNG